MPTFIGEEIEVEQSADSPRPVRFVWRGREHIVTDVLRQYVDAGFGDLPTASRKWYNRRHRRCYVVKDDRGDTFEMYLDYSDRAHKTWRLISMNAAEAPR